MLQQLRPSLVLLLTMTLITCGLYPLLIIGIGQLVFPDQANGSMVVVGGRVVGSSLIGQSFTSDRYFHGRPSAISAPGADGKPAAAPYDARFSSASNLGPTSQALLDRITADTAALKKDSGHPDLPVPVELVTTSGSGLDPDLSPAAAAYQVSRVASARKLPEEVVIDLINHHIRQRALGMFGEPVINVLELNLALDAIATPTAS